MIHDSDIRLLLLFFLFWWFHPNNNNFMFFNLKTKYRLWKWFRFLASVQDYYLSQRSPIFFISIPFIHHCCPCTTQTEQKKTRFNSSPLHLSLSRWHGRHRTHIHTKYDQPFKLHNLDVGPSTTVELSKENALEYYKQMQTIRRLETAAGNLYKEKIVRGFCHLYSGQEGCAVGKYLQRLFCFVFAWYFGNGRERKMTVNLLKSLWKKNYFSRGKRYESCDALTG